MINARLLKQQPWRFKPGDTCYVRRWAKTATVKILAQLQGTIWPHYLVEDERRTVWRVPQIHLSSIPILEKSR